MQFIRHWPGPTTRRRRGGWKRRRAAAFPSFGSRPCARRWGGRARAERDGGVRGLSRIEERGRATGDARSGVEGATSPTAGGAKNEIASIALGSIRQKCLFSPALGSARELCADRRPRKAQAGQGVLRRRASRPKACFSAQRRASRLKACSARTHRPRASTSQSATSRTITSASTRAAAPAIEAPRAAAGPLRGALAAACAQRGSAPPAVSSSRAACLEVRGACSALAPRLGGERPEEGDAVARRSVRAPCRRPLPRGPAAAATSERPSSSRSLLPSLLSCLAEACARSTIAACFPARKRARSGPPRGAATLQVR